MEVIQDTSRIAGLVYLLQNRKQNILPIAKLGMSFQPPENYGMGGNEMSFSHLISPFVKQVFINEDLRIEKIIESYKLKYLWKFRSNMRLVSNESCEILREFSLSTLSKI